MSAPRLRLPPALVAAVILSLALCGAATAFAQAVKIGIEAPMLTLARAQAWTPVHVDIATSEPLEGTIRVSFGSGSEALTLRPFSVGRGSAKRITVPVAMPGWVREIKVAVVNRRGALLAEKSLVDPTGGGAATHELHVLVIGEDPLGLPMLQQVAGLPVTGHPDCSEPRPVRVETLLPAQLPEAWFTWTGVDLVVWRRPDPSQLSPEQQAALRGWVAAGGTLVVALGDTWRTWAGSPLGALSGASPSSAEPSTELPRLLAFATGASVQEEVAIPVVRLDPIGATPRLWADADRSVPVLVDHRPGAGRVVTMGWDPGAGELRGAIVREDLWRVLLGLPLDPSDPLIALAGLPFTPAQMPECSAGADEWGSSGPTAVSVAASWRSELIGQLSRFARANPLPLGFVLGFGLIYLLLIGPADYFILRRLRRPLLTWVTFPALAIGFSVSAAVLITFQKQGDTEIRCVEVVDLHSGQGLLTGSGWCSMWSSRRQDVRLAPSRGEGFVLPMEAESLTEGALGTGARQEVGATLAGLSFRAPQWAVQTWRTGWTDASPGGIELVQSDGQLIVANASDIDLSAAWVVVEGRAWALGALPAGGSAPVRASVVPWELELLADAAPPGSWAGTTLGDLFGSLSSPWPEQPGRIDPAGEGPPMLVGLAARVAPSLPADLDGSISVLALVRAPLPALDPEALP